MNGLYVMTCITEETRIDTDEGSETKGLLLCELALFLLIPKYVVSHRA